MVSTFLLSALLAYLATCQCEVEFSESARNFSVELMYHTFEETQWHTVMSPLGVWSLLTTMSIGATENSREQLLQTLILPKKKSTVVREYNSFIKSVIVPATPDIQLKCHNYLFLDYGFEIEGDFNQTIINDFRAKVTRLDFKMPEAAEFSNSVIQKSNITVTEIYRPDDFKDSRMILTNVISFKGHWQFPFNASETRVQDFHDETGKVIGQVNMMQQQGNFQYSNLKTISAFVLELPYGETNQYSFLAILPNQNVKLADVYIGLKLLSLKDILKQLDADTEEFGLADVVVSLPRFRISTNVVLNTPLISMGIDDIFDPLKASFGSISKTEKLFVTSIVHNADIQVTETGTIGSAATSAFFADRMLPSNFNVNRPFLYFIVEKSTATNILSGVYSKPTLY